MVVNCEINFDNSPQGIYYSGQTLYGSVTLKVDKPKKVNELLLVLKGFAHVHWTEESTSTSTDSNGNSTTTTSSTSYDGHEDYIKTKTPLQSQTTLEPGTYTYRFNCLIPDTCPSSFEGSTGHIRYLVKVVLDRPWKFNQSFTKPFTVLKILDLNRFDPVIKEPFSAMIDKVFGVWPFKSEPLLARISIPQRGYVPGQKIPVSLSIDNKSNVAISEVKVRLVMYATFYSTSPKSKKLSRTVLQKAKGPGLDKRSKKSMTLAVMVPPTPSTCLYCCKIINISYEIEVEMKSNGMHRNVAGKIGVTIGNVPFSRLEVAREATESLAASSTGKSSPTLTVSSFAPDSPDAELPSYSGAMAHMNPFRNFPDLPPPSYEEAIHLPSGEYKGDEDGGQDYGEHVFRPIYPTFNMNLTRPSTTPSMQDIEKNFSQVNMKENK